MKTHLLVLSTLISLNATYANDYGEIEMKEIKGSCHTDCIINDKLHSVGVWLEKSLPQSLVWAVDGALGMADDTMDIAKGMFDELGDLTQGIPSLTILGEEPNPQKTQQGVITQLNSLSLSCEEKTGQHDVNSLVIEVLPPSIAIEEESDSSFTAGKEQKEITLINQLGSFGIEVEDIFKSGNNFFKTSAWKNLTAFLSQNWLSMYRSEILANAVNEMDPDHLGVKNFKFLRNLQTESNNTFEKMLTDNERCKKEDGMICADLSNQYNSTYDNSIPRLAFLLPILIFDDNNIKEIDSINNSFFFIPHELSRLSNLKKLNLTSECITSFEGIENLISLESLEISDSWLDSFPNLSKLTNLKTLKFSCKSCPTLEHINTLPTGLKKLELLRIRLFTIPSAILKLKELEEIDLGYNYISTVSSDEMDELIQNNKHLNFLSLLMNPLDTASREVMATMFDKYKEILITWNKLEKQRVKEILDERYYY